MRQVVLAAAILAGGLAATGAGAATITLGMTFQGVNLTSSFEVSDQALSGPIDIYDVSSWSMVMTFAQGGVYRFDGPGFMDTVNFTLTPGGTQIATWEIDFWRIDDGVQYTFGGLSSGDGAGVQFQASANNFNIVQSPPPPFTSSVTPGPLAPVPVPGAFGLLAAALASGIALSRRRAGPRARPAAPPHPAG